MSEAPAASRPTTIEEGTELKGTLISRGPVLVHGLVRGDVDAPRLTVTERGQVTGQVTARELRSAGVLEGHMTADEMYISGTVRDNTVIHAQQLEVNPERRGDAGFVVFGDCVLHVGDEPALRAAAPPVQKEVAAPADVTPQPEPAVTATAPGENTASSVVPV